MEGLHHGKPDDQLFRFFLPHHNAQNRCELRSINVCANCNCHSGKSDESMCGSYECGCK